MLIVLQKDLEVNMGQFNKNEVIVFKIEKDFW